jgi:hypothetical protein
MIATTQQNCEEYSYGFCTVGPTCPFRHVKRPAEEAAQIERIPQWYIQKVSELLTKDSVTCISQLQDYFQAVMSLGIDDEG